MSGKTLAPFGSWKSPISAALIAQGARLPSDLVVDGDELYWLESRPEEGGRYALCTLRGRKCLEVLDKEFNVRTRVHEYGGASYLVDGGDVYFTNFRDQLLYVKEKDAPPQPITKEGVRYAELVVDTRRNRVIGVREDHTASGGQVVNTVCAIYRTGASQVIVSGNDFYSNPRLNHDQTRLAWLTWNHPNMPWDGTELRVAELKEDGSLGPSQLVAGGRDESVFQPEWSPDGILYFVSDRSGWWNLYCWDGAYVKRLVSMNAEFGRPLWSLGQSTYAFESERIVVCSFLKDGNWNLAILDTSSLKLRRLKTPFTDISYVRASPGRGYFIAASPTETGVIATINIKRESTKVVYRPMGPGVDSAFISIPKHISFPTTDRKRAYAFFYEPKNKNYAAPRGQRPPLVVISHGGPTSFSPASLAMSIVYWTSRGFAVLNVNYRGSTGYGRRYMKELEGMWGIVDVDDCTNGALYLARLGKVDRKKLVIRGGSAGGYTTLCALTFKKVFAAGASYYGVSDLEGLERETHKFESHYCDRLVAPYPEKRDVYLERSAIYHTDKLSVPVIFFQGLEDVIVLPSQAERMVEALRVKGVPVAYMPFEGEQHGFRRAESIIRAYEAELYFYSKILGFPMVEKVRPVEIQNLGVKSTPGQRVTRRSLRDCFRPGPHQTRTFNSGSLSVYGKLQL